MQLIQKNDVLMTAWLVMKTQNNSQKRNAVAFWLPDALCSAAYALVCY